MSFLFQKGSNDLKMKSKRSFKPIKSSNSYKQLDQLQNLPSSTNLRQDRLFGIVSHELKQVTSDVIKINNNILSEIDTELQQCEELHRKLKRSSEKIDEAYSSLIKQRGKYDSYFNKNLNLFHVTTTKTDSNLILIKNITEEIISNFNQTNNSLPEKEQLIKAHTLNEQHYPLLFELLRKSFPEKFNEHDKQSTQECSPSIEIVSQGIKKLSHNDFNFYRSSKEIVSFTDSHDYQSVCDISSKCIHPEARNTSFVLLMPKFQKTCVPSISTTVENVEISQPFTSASTPQNETNKTDYI